MMADFFCVTLRMRRVKRDFQREIENSIRSHKRSGRTAGKKKKNRAGM
jgi:hypothetical protein